MKTLIHTLMLALIASTGIVVATNPADADQLRAERRLGELIQAQKKTVGLNQGANGSKVSGSKREPVKDDRPKLSDIGVDKKLSSTVEKFITDAVGVSAW